MRLLVGASVAGAAASFLLVTGRLGFEQSTAVSIVVILLQVLWMLWLNRRFLADGVVPPRVSRFGIAFAVLLLASMALFGVSFGLGADTAARTMVQAVAGTVGGVAWLAWPLWFILLGRHLATGTGPGGRRARPRPPA